MPNTIANFARIINSKNLPISTPIPRRMCRRKYAPCRLRRSPFKVAVSPRIERLPPYLFGRINKMKYDKRVAGVDIIDLGMGNPTDPTPAPVVERLASAALDPRNHRYKREQWHQRAEERSRPQIRRAVRRDARSRGRSHRHHRQQGRAQPHVPGAARPGRYRRRARSRLPRSPLRARHGRGERLVRIPLGNDEAFLERMERTVEGLFPTPKIIILNYPHNPTSMTIDPAFWQRAIEICRRRGIMIISDFAYGEINFDGYRRPVVPLRSRCQGNRRRVQHHVQELQHGRLARGVLLR